MKIVRLTDGSVNISLESREEEMWIYALSNSSVRYGEDNAEELNICVRDNAYLAQGDLFFGMKEVLGID